MSSFQVFNLERHYNIYLRMIGEKNWGGKGLAQQQALQLTYIVSQYINSFLNINCLQM